jgi:hypothetical protein
MNVLFDLSSSNMRLQKAMHDYYVGPLVFEEIDGIRHYRFRVYLKNPIEVVYGHLATLLSGVASIAENGPRRIIHISPLHQEPMMVRRQVISFIEASLGDGGYVERYTNDRVAETLSPRTGASRSPLTTSLSKNEKPMPAWM